MLFPCPPIVPFNNASILSMRMDGGVAANVVCLQRWTKLVKPTFYDAERGERTGRGRTEDSGLGLVSHS